MPWVPQDRAADVRVADFWATCADEFDALSDRARALEEENNRAFIKAYGLSDELDATVPLERVSLQVNASWRFPSVDDPTSRRSMTNAEAAKDLVSYAVGCMAGRFSLDKPGLILGAQGATIQAAHLEATYKDTNTLLTYETPDQALAALGEPDHRWGGPAALGVGNNHRFTAFDHRHTGICCSQVNTEYFCHFPSTSNSLSSLSNI